MGIPFGDQSGLFPTVSFDVEDPAVFGDLTPVRAINQFIDFALAKCLKFFATRSHPLLLLLFRKLKDIAECPFSRVGPVW